MLLFYFIYGTVRFVGTFETQQQLFRLEHIYLQNKNKLTNFGTDWTTLNHRV